MKLNIIWHGAMSCHIVLYLETQVTQGMPGPHSLQQCYTGLTMKHDRRPQCIHTCSRSDLTSTESLLMM